MIRTLLEGRYEAANLSHVRMAFSRDMNDVGKWQFGKLLHLVRVILLITWRRLTDRCEVLYYPPAGPNRVPFYRDVMILCSTRWMFKQVIFHFHSAGLSELCPKLNRMETWLFRRAYFRPHLAIRLPLSPEDGRAVRAKRECTVPNGIPDATSPEPATRSAATTPRVLFVGVLCEAKGVTLAVEALSLLARKGLACHFEFMGRWQSVAYEREVKALIQRLGIEERVTFLGVKTGQEKKEAFLRNGLFCFPTHFESEAFSVVLLEAMQFSMPVVATRWRGIPSIVDDGETGFLVPPRDSRALAEKLEYLMTHPEEARQMGQKGREKYLKEFTVEQFWTAMDKAFFSLQESVATRS